MTTFTLSTSVRSDGKITLPDGKKIIQRIFAFTGSNVTKARCMADADNDLVLQCQRGNTLAFESLVQNHQQMVHALTFRMTGSTADAEDLAQEAFIRAYEQIHSFNGGAKFSTWLYSIAVRACLNWRRDEARRFHAYGELRGGNGRAANGRGRLWERNGVAGAVGIDETAGQTTGGGGVDDL